MIKGIAHVCLTATDLAAAERFYCAGVGCAKVFEFVRAGQVVGFYLQVAPRSYVEVFQSDAVELAEKNPLRHFCLETDDIDQIGARLRKHGYAATEKTLGADQSWQLWTTDPSGVQIEFHQYTNQSSQITHTNCLLS